MIRHWYEAIADANPIYTNKEYARKIKYRSIVSPPMIVPAWANRLVLPHEQKVRN